MNGPLRMYPMREIVRHDAPLSSLPSCMYSVRDLHSGSPARPDISEQNNTALPGMAALEQKQERILKQLEELKQQMLSIRQDLKQSGLSVSPPANVACKSSAGVSSKATKKINIKDVPNIVIHSHPSHPPYSLLILKKLWANYLDLRVETFVHSSLIKLPENARKFVEELSREECSNGVPKVTLTLIWKDVSVNKLEFLIGLTPLVGECNLLRFLARSTSVLTYDESDHQMDSLLDLSYRIICTPTKTKRAHLLQQVSNRLAKSTFLFGETICVADIAMYSAIKQVAGSGEVNVRVGKWMGRCEG